MTAHIISDNEFGAESVRGLDDGHRYIPAWTEVRSLNGAILRWTTLSGWCQYTTAWVPCTAPLRADGNPVAVGRLAVPA